MSFFGCKKCGITGMDSCQKLKSIKEMLLEILEESGKGYRKNNKIFSRIFVDFFEKRRIIMFRMDTLIKWDSTGTDDLKELQSNHIIVGTKQLRKALNRSGVRRVYLAQDADPAITAPLEDLCIRNGVPCSWVRRMLDLGRACGIDVGAAAAAVAK